MLLNRRNLLISLLLALHYAQAGQNSSPSNWQPTMELVRRVEAKVIMPTGAPPLSAYRRHYAGTMESGRRVLVAVYVLADDTNLAGVSIESSKDSLPLIHDGGCDIVSFDLVDPEKGMPKPSRNGVA